MFLWQEDGTESYQFDNAFKDGEYSIRVVAEDPAGNASRIAIALLSR